MTKEESMATNRVKRQPVSVYLPPNGMADRWKRLADKAGLSLSQYVQNIVEDHIRSEETIDPNGLSRLDRIKERANRIEKQQLDMEKEIERIRDERNRFKKRVTEEMVKAFQREDVLDIVMLVFKIDTLLKERGVVKEDELMNLLHIDPDDTELVKATNQHMDSLISHNHIKRYNGKIIWVK